MKKNILNKWGWFGYQLGRLEILWGSPYDIENAKDEIKNSLTQFLDNEDVNYNDTNYKSFMESILNYFRGSNIEIFSCIAIGICVFRTQLAMDLQTSQKKDADEFVQLAESALSIIPTYIVKDKGLLFSVIKQNIDKNILDLLDVIYRTIKSDTTSSQNNNISITKSEKQQYVFVSYSSRDYSLVQEIVEIFRENNISIWMAPESIPVGSDYTESIYDAINNCSAFLLLLTDNSQSSKWVPKEMDLAITLDKVIFPVHLDRSKIKNNIYFRLTNSQVIEAYDKRNDAILITVKDIKKFLS